MNPSGRLEQEVRAQLQRYRILLDAGKGTFGHPDYVSDGTWRAWQLVVVTLEDILANAKEDDG